MRLYAPGDKTSSVQAAKTQKWQSSFFVESNPDDPQSALKIKNLYSV